ncbi:hypothetical protein J3Q26_09530 [Bordetella holmesii]|nr:hypothetical protein FYA36_08330 [Bordetella holmesii]QJP62773.1 hypothetical protein FYB63_08315 [Bordetella holmesii]QSY66017.1 hypothetical protein J3Q26_09530 [Bordetella holmesii]
MPPHQNRSMPEQRSDGYIDNSEQKQRDADSGHEGHDVLLDLHGAQPFGQV